MKNIFIITKKKVNVFFIENFRAFLKMFFIENISAFLKIYVYIFLNEVSIFLFINTDSLELILIKNHQLLLKKYTDPSYQNIYIYLLVKVFCYVYFYYDGDLKNIYHMD